MSETIKEKSQDVGKKPAEKFQTKPWMKIKLRGNSNQVLIVFKN